MANSREIKAIQASRMVASILEPADMLEPTRIRKASRSNSERIQPRIKAGEISSGRTASAVCWEQTVLDSSPLDIKIQKKKRYARLASADQGDYDYDYQKAPTKVDRETSTQAQEKLNSYIQSAKKNFSEGKMDLRRANKYLSAINNMIQIGARVASSNKGIYEQIRLLTGDLI
jgi:hypothetical protein